MDEFTLSLETSPRPEDAAVVADGLRRAIAAELGSDRPARPFSVFLRSADDAVLGGVNGRVAHGELHIDQIWCDESIRGRGHGSRLLARAESFGREFGARAALLNTVMPERVDYYGRRGYELLGEVPGMAGGRPVYFLRKRL
ncbi:MAG: GNAT family N-acetyltransferase [Gemmatimonadota bacterium]